MGIQNLTKLVKEKDVYVDEHLRGGRLVIDGANLVFHLYFTSAVDVGQFLDAPGLLRLGYASQHGAGLDQNRGGEYGAFKDLVTQFIGALRTCDIDPYVVFDGCADFADQKWETQRERAEQLVMKAHEAAVSGEAKGILPILILEVFRQTLRGLNVPMVRSYTEADQQVAALAQEWGCPVLSNDSDFFIFPMTGGMLPTAHFRWQRVEERNGQSSIPCKRYFSSRFCKVVHIGPQILPVFAVLAGNDYTRNTFGSSDMRLVQQQRAPYTKLHCLLQWISGIENADPQKVFEEFLKKYPSPCSISTSDLLEAAGHYSLPSSSLSSYFSQDILPPLSPQMEEVVPDWMRRPLTGAHFSSDFLDVLTSKRVGLSVVVDHKDKPSANQVSLPLRRVLYGLLLGEDGAVEERDRDGDQVKFIPVQADVSVSPQLSLYSLPQAAEEQRKLVLLKALGMTEQSLNSLPFRLSDLALPLAATCFWLKEARPRPPPDLLKVLLIGWCKGDTLRKEAGSKQFLNWQWSNWLNQWQSCLRDSFLLNQLLGTPLPEPPMARLFSGILVHDLLYKMEHRCLDPSHTEDEDFKALLSTIIQSHTDKQEIQSRPGPLLLRVHLSQGEE